MRKSREGQGAGGNADRLHIAEEMRAESGLARELGMGGDNGIVRDGISLRHSIKQLACLEEGTAFGVLREEVVEEKAEG